mmetsp:Transcript_33706/g.92369  ORF Transcript_33706/g.92369 Transcript_33706/m.92369 type:complete len:282 (-) Transcript_33706:488-1333(-)
MSPSMPLPLYRTFIKLSSPVASSIRSSCLRRLSSSTSNGFASSSVYRPVGLSGSKMPAPVLLVEQSCSPKSRTEQYTPTASMTIITPVSPMGLPLSWSERSVWFSLRPSATAFVPSSPIRLLETSRKSSDAFSLSALPIAAAPRSPRPFHARLRRTREESLRPSAIAIAPTERTEFHEKSACLSGRDDEIRVPSAAPPLSPMPLSLTSSFVSFALLLTVLERLCAPMSPMLLPRSESSLIRPFASSASAIATQPRAAKLLYERSRLVMTWFSRSAAQTWSR